MILNNKIVVVTGGAGLLGRAFCNKISQSGGTPIVADINLENAKFVAKQIRNAVPMALDITNKESINSLIQQIDEKHGPIHALVNNAYPRNKNYGRTFFDVEFGDFCENINLNLGGYFLTSQLFLKYFLTQKNGNIINISSIYGIMAPRFEIYNNTSMTMPVEYSVIKSGLIHLTKYMQKFVKGSNIRVNSISPGGIFDKQNPNFLQNYKDHCINKGMLNPEDMLGTLAFLLSDDSKYINGQNIIVDNGFSL